MSIADSLTHRAFLYGYSRRACPRQFRRALARTQLHRAWLAGSLGYFVDVDTGQTHGPTRMPSSRLAPETRQHNTKETAE